MNWHHIPSNVPSLKNGKEIAKIPNGKGGFFTKLVPSKRHKAYTKATGIVWKSVGREFRLQTMGVPKPFQIGFYFVRDSRRIFDYSNALDTCQDLMVEYNWIEDDCMNDIKPILCGYHVDKSKCGVYICLFEKKIAFPYPDHIIAS